MYLPIYFKLSCYISLSVLITTLNSRTALLLRNAWVTMTNLEILKLKFELVVEQLKMEKFKYFFSALCLGFHYK